MDIENTKSSEVLEEIFLKGRQLLSQRNSIVAIECFEHCFHHKYKESDSLFYGARARFELKDYIGAIYDYDRVILRNPKNAGAYNNRAIAQVSIGEYEEALNDYNTAIEIKPNERSYYANRGMNWLNLDSPNNALADFSKAIELDPKYARAYIYRGGIYQSFMNFKKALADYDVALSIENRLYDAYLRRGKIYAYFGDIEYGFNKLSDGAEFISYAFWHKNEDPQILDTREETPHHYNKAIEDFTNAIKLAPNRPDPYIMRSEVYLKIALFLNIYVGDHDYHKKARADAFNAIKNSEGDSGLYALAGAEARMGNVDLAIRHLDAALNIGETEYENVLVDSTFENLLDNLELSAVIENHKIASEYFEDEY